MTLKVNIVAADKRIWSGDADMVVSPSVDGEIGLLQGHEPIMTLLAPGVVKISERSVLTSIRISGGFMSLYDDELSIVADSAEIE